VANFYECTCGYSCRRAVNFIAHYLDCDGIPISADAKKAVDGLCKLARDLDGLEEAPHE